MSGGNPSNEAQLATLIAQQSVLSQAVGEMKDAIHKMASVVQKLAIIDERQVTDREALGRAFKEIDKVDARVKLLEAAAPLQRQTSDWVHRAVGQVISAVVAATLALVVGSRIAAPAPTPPTVKHEAQTTQ